MLTITNCENIPINCNDRSIDLFVASIINNRNGVPVPNLRTNIGQNEISHTFSSTPSRSPKLYWSLPPKFTGNKVTSYGGHLSITQRYDERQQQSGVQRFSDADIIITGDRITLVWINPNEIPPAQTVVRYVRFLLHCTRPSLRRLFSISCSFDKHLKRLLK